MNISISTRLGFLKIQSRRNNRTVNNRISWKFRRNCKKVKPRYKLQGLKAARVNAFAGSHEIIQRNERATKRVYNVDSYYFGWIFDSPDPLPSTVPVTTNKKIVSLFVIRTKIRPDSGFSSHWKPLFLSQKRHALSQFQTEKNYPPSGQKDRKDPTTRIFPTLSISRYQISASNRLVKFTCENIFVFSFFLPNNGKDDKDTLFL